MRCGANRCTSRPGVVPKPPKYDWDPARKAQVYIAALGGRANIVRVDACAETRLPLVVRHTSQILETGLRAAGIAAVVKFDGAQSRGGHTVHLLAGRNADQYAAEMRGQLAS